MPPPSGGGGFGGIGMGGLGGMAPAPAMDGTGAGRAALAILEVLAVDLWAIRPPTNLFDAHQVL